jgi:hypothetical protein
VGVVVERTVASLRGFLREVDRLSDEWDEEFWFRGQGSAADPLVPGLYRYRYPELRSEESEIRHAFQGLARPFLAREPRTKWEWYFLMQHHGVPTRLLDWSEGALLGLHFALRSNPPGEDAAVWVLDPRWLHRHINSDAKLLPDPEDAENTRAGQLLDRYLSTSPYARPHWPPLPIPIRPPHISPRFAVQRSCFTLHGSEKDGFARAVQHSPRPRLVKLRIRSGAVSDLLTSLDECGVLESTVFPDLDGLGRQLRAEFTETRVIVSCPRVSTANHARRR